MAQLIRTLLQSCNTSPTAPIAALTGITIISTAAIRYEKFKNQGTPYNCQPMDGYSAIRATEYLKGTIPHLFAMVYLDWLLVVFVALTVLMIAWLLVSV